MKKSLTLVLLVVIALTVPLTILSLQQSQDNRSKAASVKAAKTVQPGGSISSVVNAAQPGDIITIAGGTYNEQLTISKSGSAGNYITIQASPGEKVILTGGSLKITNQSYLKIIGITIKDSSSFGAYIDKVNNVIFQNFEVDTSQDGGLVILASSNVLVDSCNIHGSNSRGTSANHEALSIGEGSSNFEIKNCNVHDNGEEGIDAKYNANANGSIHDNIVSNNRGPNIYVDSSVGVKVYNNISYGTTEGSKAGIAIAAETAYTGSNNPRKASNIDIYNNISYGNAGGGINFYTEPGGTISDVRIYNNTVVNNAKSAIVMATSALSGNNPVFNNIFSGNSVGGGNGLTMGTNLTTDAKFVSANDYHLQAGSPAIDKGTAAGAPAFDKDNKTRPAGGGIDMGAYEFGATGGTAPTTNPITTMPEPTNIAPSFVCLTNEPCTTPVPSQQAGTTPPGGTNPGTPPIGGTNPSPGNPAPNPGTNPQPCPTNGTAGVFHNKKKKKSGGGFIEQFIRFLIWLIEFILRGGNVPAPNPSNPTPGNPIPCPKPTTAAAPTIRTHPTARVNPTNATPTNGTQPGTTPTTNPVGAATLGPRPVSLTPSNNIITVTPGQSLSEIINRAVPGDSIVVKAGIYPKISLSGKNATSEIKVIAAAGETVNVAGASIQSSSNITFKGINWTDGVLVQGQGCNAIKMQGGTSNVSRSVNNFNIQDHCRNTSVEDMRITGGDSHFNIQASNNSTRSSDTFIRNNDMGDVKQDHIIINRGMKVTVEGNIMHGIIDSGEHSDGVQSVGTDGLVINRNHFWTPRAQRDVARDGNDHAIMLNHEPSTDRETRNVVISNNLIHDWFGTGIAAAGAINTQIFNNTIYDNGRGGGARAIVLDPDPGKTVTVAMWNNVFDKISVSVNLSRNENNFVGSGGSGGTGGLTGSPGFTSCNGLNYCLSSGSPLIDSGTANGAPTVDLLGKPRSGNPDRGALEK